MSLNSCSTSQCQSKTRNLFTATIPSQQVNATEWVLRDNSVVDIYPSNWEEIPQNVAQPIVPLPIPDTGQKALVWLWGKAKLHLYPFFVFNWDSCGGA